MIPRRRLAKMNVVYAHDVKDMLESFVSQEGCDTESLFQVVNFLCTAWEHCPYTEIGLKQFSLYNTMQRVKKFNYDTFLQIQEQIKEISTDLVQGVRFENEAKEALKRVSKELADSYAKISELEEQSEVLTEEKVAIQNYIENAEKEIELSKVNYSDVSNSVLELRQVNEDIALQNKTLEKMLAEKTAVQSTKAKEVRSLDSEVRNLSKNEDALSNKIQNIKLQNVSLERLIKKLNNMNEKEGFEAEKDTKCLEQMQNDIKALKMEKTEAKKHFRKAKEKLKEVEAQKSEKEAGHEELCFEVHNLELRKEEFAKIIHDMRKKLKVTTKENSCLRTFLEQLTGRLKGMLKERLELETVQDIQTDEMKYTKKEFENWKGLVEADRTDVDLMKDTIEKIKSEKHALTGVCDNLEKQLGNVAQKSKIRSTEISLKKADVNQMSLDLDEIERKVNAQRLKFRQSHEKIRVMTEDNKTQRDLKHAKSLELKTAQSEMKEKVVVFSEAICSLQESVSQESKIEIATKAKFQKLLKDTSEINIQVASVNVELFGLQQEIHVKEELLTENQNQLLKFREESKEKCQIALERVRRLEKEKKTLLDFACKKKSKEEEIRGYFAHQRELLRQRLLPTSTKINEMREEISRMKVQKEHFEKLNRDLTKKSGEMKDVLENVVDQEEALLQRERELDLEMTEAEMCSPEAKEKMERLRVESLIEYAAQDTGLGMLKKMSPQKAKVIARSQTLTSKQLLNHIATIDRTTQTELL